MNKKLKPNKIAFSGIFFALLVFVAIGVIASLLLYPLGVLLFVSMLGYALYQYVKLSRTEYIITDEKVISNVNLGGEKHEEVGFTKIQNTSLKRPFFYQLIGDYGNISVSTAGSNFDQLRLRAVNNPKKVHKTLVEGIDDIESPELDQTEQYDMSNGEYEKLREASERLKNQIKGGEL